MLRSATATRSSMDFRILGPLEVEEGGRQVPLGGEKQRALLALLLLSRGRPVSTDRLIEEIWSGRPPATAVKSVQVYVARLRRALGEGRIITRSRGDQLAVAPGELDVDRFDALVHAGSGAPAKEAAERLREALALFRGRPLADLSLSWGAGGDRGARRAPTGSARGPHRCRPRVRAAPALSPELEALVARRTLREHLIEQLALALYRSGRQADALEAYRAAAARMRDELGLEPGRSLQELERGSSDRMRARLAAARCQARRTAPELGLSPEPRPSSSPPLLPPAPLLSRAGAKRPLLRRAGRRDRQRLERPARRAHRAEPHQGPGRGHHRGQSLLGMEPDGLRDGADRSRQRPHHSSDRLSGRRHRRLGVCRRPKPLARRLEAGPHGYPPGQRGRTASGCQRTRRRTGSRGSRRATARSGSRVPTRASCCASTRPRAGCNTASAGFPTHHARRLWRRSRLGRRAVTASTGSIRRRTRSPRPRPCRSRSSPASP